MKWIEYVYVCNASKGIFLRKKVAYNEANLAIAKIESYDGNYIITNDDDADFEVKPIAINVGGTGACNASDARKNLEVAQAIESVDYPGCYYRMRGNEVEWLNPPMQIGVEYRTTERFAGSAVYTAVVSAKARSAILGSFGTTFAPPTGGVNMALRWSGRTSNSVVLPYNLHNPDSAVYRRVEVQKDSVNTKAIRCTCYAGQDAIDANETWYIQLWYTKAETLAPPIIGG